MAQGFLVSCVPSANKLPKKKGDMDGMMIRLLRNRGPVRRFLQQYIDPADPQPLIKVLVFNSNGYLERTVENADAMAEFKAPWE